MPDRRHILLEFSDGTSVWMDVPYVAPCKGVVHRAPECSANMVYGPNTLIRTQPLPAIYDLQTTYEYEPRKPLPDPVRSWAIEQKGYCFNMVYDTGGTKIRPQPARQK